MKICKTCDETKPLSAFYVSDRRGYLRGSCKVCHNENMIKRRKGKPRSAPKKLCPACSENMINVTSKSCWDCFRDIRKTPPPIGSNKWKINSGGYKTYRGWREHRVVMERLLGRSLVSGENVHHINGVKHDNRPENLELWVTHQPSGQRPEDLVAWAWEILERYDK